MLQEAVTWDPQNMIVEPSTEQKTYILFLVVVCIVTVAKLIRVWRVALPFRLSTHANDPMYLKLLRSTQSSLCRWMWCILLGWGIVSSTALYGLCNGLLSERVTGRIVILIHIRESSALLATALWVDLFVFLIRWHVSTRIERLRD
jgi:hypothetical protein